MILKIKESVNLLYDCRPISSSSDTFPTFLTSIIKLQFNSDNQQIRYYNSMLNSIARRILAPSLKPFSLIKFFNSTSTEVDFQSLKQQFLKHKDMLIFDKIIKQSDNVVDNINYFKIYKILDQNSNDIKTFQDYFMQIDLSVKKKSDNMRMLLAKIKANIAKKHEDFNNYYDAINNLEQAMEVLEQCVIPPVLPYYQIYRYYGFLQLKLNKVKEAAQALKESVTMIEKLIQHSEDHVNNNANCKNQAKAYYILAEIEPQNSQEWVEKCIESWKDYEGDKLELPEYAESILAQARLEAKKNPQKAQQMLTVHIYQVKNPELKEYMKSKKKQILKQK